jgi:hypothetical protein
MNAIPEMSRMPTIFVACFAAPLRVPLTTAARTTDSSGFYPDSNSESTITNSPATTEMSPAAWFVSQASQVFLDSAEPSIRHLSRVGTVLLSKNGGNVTPQAKSHHYGGAPRLIWSPAT